MGPLGAESGLVTITGLLRDRDVSPGTERGGEANKGMRRTRGRWRWRGETTGGLQRRPADMIHRWPLNATGWMSVETCWRATDPIFVHVMKLPCRFVTRRMLVIDFIWITPADLMFRCCWVAQTWTASALETDMFRLVLRYRGNSVCVLVSDNHNPNLGD